MREGRAGEIWATPALPKRSQGRFIQAWAAALPYMSAPENLRAWTADDFDHEMHAFGYRMRTLLGAGASESAVKSAQKAERLYLWTWRWLADPDAASAARVEETLDSFTGDEIRNRCALGDLRLIALSLRWIAAFQPDFRPLAERFAQAHEPPDARWPEACAFERSLAEAFAAKGASFARALARCKQNLVYTSPGYRWGAAIDALLPRRARASPSDLRAPAGAILVNVQANRVRPPRRRGRAKPDDVLSAPLARLFEAIAARKGAAISFATILDLCFGIAPYDEDAHRTKAHNLLVRARRLLPTGIELRSQADVLYASGDLERIVVIRGEREFAAPKWLRVAPSPATPHLDRWIRPQAVLRHARGAGALTRRQMQEMVPCSKATAHRLLSTWERQGLVRRSGSGRAARYRVDLAPVDDPR